MDCCSVKNNNDPVNRFAGSEAFLVCTKCGREGKPVSRKTILAMVKPDFIEQALSGNYGFCPEHECPIVYFEERGTCNFTVSDLRITVGIKADSDPIPLCYCFGFEESHLRNEIAETGVTSIPNKISHLIREGLCACDVRNPSGNCCLGEVIRTSERLKLEAAKRAERS